MAVSLLQPEQPVQKQGVSFQPITYDTDPLKMQERIERNIYGMAGVVPTETVQADFWTGNEDRLRQNVASNLSLSEYQDNLSHVSQIAMLAAQEGRPLTEAEQELIVNQEIPRYNPALVLEILYSRRYMEDLDSEDTLLEEAEAEDLVATKQIRDFAEQTIQKQELARRILEEVSDMWENRGFGNQAWDFARGIIPGYTYFQQKGKLSDAGKGDFWLGDAMSAQLTALWSLPPEEFESRLREAVYELANENTLEAMSLASAAVQYSGSDALWDNVWTGLDIADAATLGAATAIGVAGYLGKAQRAIRTSAQGGDAVTRQVAQGDISGAARTTARRHLNQQGADTAVDDQIQKLQGIVPDLLNGEKFVSSPGSLSAEATRRILNQVSRDEELLLATFENLPIVRRLPDEARERAFLRAENQIQQLYPNLEDSLINFRRRYDADEVFGGVDVLEAYFGNTKALPFRQREYAQFYGDEILKLPKGGFDVVEDQGNFLLRVTKTVDETDIELTDFRIATGYKTESTFYNSWLSLLDSSNNQLASAHNAVRSVATHGGEAMMSRMAAVAQNIGRLNKGEITRLTEVMDAARMQQRTVKLPDGTSEQVTGRFFKTASELEQEYQKRFKRNPTEKEVSAYMSFRTLTDIDYLMRNAAQYRDLARQGVQQHAFEVVGEGGALATSKFVNGRMVDSLPVGQGDFTVGWYNTKTGEMDSGIYDRLSYYRWQSLNELLESGDYKIIQLADTRDSGIGGLFNSGGEPLDFVVVKNVKTKPLAAQQVSYNEGGHWIYPHTGVYLKQASTHNTKTGRRVYDGDTTLMYFQTTAEGRRFEKAFNEARELLQQYNAGAVSRATVERFLGRNLPYDFDGFKKLFDGEDAAFNLETPFVMTQSGQRAADVLPLERVFRDQEIYDPSKSPFDLMARVEGRFTQERSERLLNITTGYGGQGNPVFNLRPAPMLNSLEALRRSGADMARSRFFNDYKHREVENWASQFGDLLDADVFRVKNNPMEFIKNPKFKTNTPNEQIQLAMTARRNILTLLQQYSDSDSVWRSFKQAAANAVYKVGGTRAVDMVEPLLWTNKTDPVAAIRGFAFDAKLGMFNVLQLPLQASAVSMSMAIDGSPVRAVQSVLAGSLLRARMLSEGAPQIQKHFTGKFAKALGLDEATLDEMYHAWRASGFDQTGGALTYLNDYLNPSDLFSGPLNRARDASRFFFREGNNIHKSTSFILSYLRWRQANPKARLNNAGMEQIISRANTYYLNMSRNSDAAWQNPKNWMAQIGALPFQFAAFQHRLTSLLIGRELSGMEKLRLLGVNSLLWGVPVGLGGTAVGAFFPAGEALRGAAIDQGYNPETADTVTRIMMDGILDIGIENVLGIDTNVSERFGPGGLDWAKILVDSAFGEGDIREFIGAAPNFVIDTLSQTKPITAGMMSVFFGEDDTYLHIVQDDIITALREVSSVNNTTRAWQVYQSGLWLTKREGLVASYDEGDPSLAIAAALGLTPQEIADTYLKMDSVNSHDNAKRETVNQAIVYFERGLRAHANGDFDQGQAFFKHAKAMMEISDLLPTERFDAWSRAARSNRSLIETIEERWMMQRPGERFNWNPEDQ